MSEQTEQTNEKIPEKLYEYLVVIICQLPGEDKTNITNVYARTPYAKLTADNLQVMRIKLLNDHKEWSEVNFINIIPLGRVK